MVSDSTPGRNPPSELSVDPDVVFERASASHRPGDLRPGGSGDPRWVAEDPETGCRGVGRFEKAARANLVYAVEAYHEEPDESVPYLSSGTGRTVEMRWRGDDESGLGERLGSLFPF
jgi:hypothetical protein